MKNGTEFKEKQIWRFIEALAGAFWSLILPAAAAVLAVFVDYSALGATEISCIIFAYIAILILEIAAIKIFLLGLNDCYFNGKTAFIVYEDGLQISVRGKKLFKSAFVWVEFDDISDFSVSLTKTQWIRGNSWSGEVYKVKQHKYGTISFKDNKSNEYFSVSIDDCMYAAELTAKNLDESQIDKENNDLRI